MLALFARCSSLGKFALIAALSRAFGAAPGTALRVALALAQGGEFGFVLLPLAGAAGIVPERAAAAAARGDDPVDARARRS